MDPFGFETSAAWQDIPSSAPMSSPLAAPSSSNSFFLPPPPASTSAGFVVPTNDGFDDFDDFTPAPVTTDTAGAEEDEFGEFGEFGDPEPPATVAEPDAFSSNLDDDGFGFGEDDMFKPAGMADWQPIRVRPLPDPLELSQQVRELLAPILRGPQVDAMMSGEGIRYIESATQLLATSESRILYKTLIQDPAPQLRPPNWIRSRIRRQHLITLGIPVNLDEVNPQANGKAMPAINIITRPASAPPRPRSQMGHRGVNGQATPSRAGTPTPSPGFSRHRTVDSASTIQNLGPKPEMDQEKVTEVLALDPETLPLLSVAKLEAHLATLRSLTVNASSLLTYLLQTREALNQDAEMYNKMIGQYISQAQQQQSKGKASNKRGTMG